MSCLVRLSQLSDSRLRILPNIPACVQVTPPGSPMAQEVTYFTLAAVAAPMPVAPVAPVAPIAPVVPVAKAPVCAGGTVTVSTLGDTTYGAAADECVQMCSPSFALTWIPQFKEMSCEAQGFATVGETKSVRPFLFSIYPFVSFNCRASRLSSFLASLASLASDVYPSLRRSNLPAPRWPKL
jgi:hypothetical protein